LVALPAGVNFKIRASTHVAFRMDKNGLLHIKHLVTVSTNDLTTTEIFLNFIVNSEVLLEGEGDGDENAEPFEETVVADQTAREDDFSI
jgi:hypothetical protein